MKILLTGVAGFIGMQLAVRLLNLGHIVVGIDSLNSYYDVSLKKSRLDYLSKYKEFTFIKVNIGKIESLREVFLSHKFDIVLHFAAQAGVRHSVQSPEPYMEANILGFFNVIECCRKYSVGRLIYASSSSVYGNNSVAPYTENQSADRPLNFYAASKRSNELMAYSYGNVHNLISVGLRLFTVYGPWGRPDMALYSFTRKILSNEAIDIYNNGDMLRDFTYIDDIVGGVVLAVDTLCAGGQNFSSEVFNVGCGQPVKLLNFVEEIEASLGKKAVKNFLPIQVGDAKITYADTSKFTAWCGYRPKTSIGKGIDNFVRWYKSYYK
jgi:UDP-glucuronate 4-epimerase